MLDMQSIMFVFVLLTVHLCQLGEGWLFLTVLTKCYHVDYFKGLFYWCVLCSAHFIFVILIRGISSIIS